ncbi:MAG: type II secretion system minor pseudopilin GspI [Pseudomonadota bacterium]
MRRDRTTEAGFSLMEVLIALSILATTAVGFLSVIRGSVEGARQVEEKQLARIVADNQLTDLFWSIEPIELGISQGVERQLGRNFNWVMNVQQSQQEGVWLVGVQVRLVGDATSPVLAEAGTLVRAAP